VNIFKIIKYNGTMDQLNKKLKNIKINGVTFRAEFTIIIVSSLAAIPNFTIHNLSAIINSNCRSPIQL
jgi:hypothetical protein